MQEALTYDDILLTPRYSEILPHEADTATKFSRNVPLKIPIVSSPMDTVTEHKMAIAMALEGGIGIIHKNMSPEQKEKMRERHKRWKNMDPEKKARMKGKIERKERANTRRGPS